VGTSPVKGCCKTYPLTGITTLEVQHESSAYPSSQQETPIEPHNSNQQPQLATATTR